MQTSQYTAQILKELGRLPQELSDEDTDKLIDRLLEAEKIFVAGAGRSGLMARGFAIRLMHMGLYAYVVGESITPNAAAHDLLLIGSGSGSTKSLAAMAEKAKSLGAQVGLVTIMPESTIGKLADIVVKLPGVPKEASGGRESIQPMGSLFEQSLLLFYDALVLRLMDRQGITADMMFQRHANLE